MEETLSFGPWLKRLRAELDLTQEALAELVGCAPQTIRTYESGTRRPSRDTADRLATILKLAAPQREQFVRLARAKIAEPAGKSHPFAPPQQPPYRRDEAVDAEATERRAMLPVAPNALIGRARELGEAVMR